MTKASFDRLMKGAREAAAVAAGEQPAASITFNGHTYVPTARVKELEDILFRSGIVEISVRNPSVLDYMRHWEGRAEKAEAELAAMAGLFEALDACEAAMSIVEPRSNKAQYLEVLAQARAALRKARGDE
jgi:hypothetical protein